MRNAALSLLALLLCSSVFASGHDVTVPFLGPSPLVARNPSVATNGETFAAVWYNQGEIYGAIADPTGRRMTAADMPVMPISLSAGGVVTDALTAVGRDYVLFWSDSSTSYLTNLGPDLKPKQTIRLAGLPSLLNVSVASNASQIIVAGFTGNIFPPAQTVAYLLNRDGSLARTPVDLGGVGRIHATWSGNDFLIATATTTGVVLERVTSESTARLQISHASGRFSDPMPGTAAAASSGDETVVVWSESADSTPPMQTFWSAIISGDGHVTGQQIYAQPPVPTGAQANLIWNGEAFVATFGNLVFRLDRKGIPLGPAANVSHSINAMASIGEVVYGLGANPFAASAMVVVLHTASGIYDARSEFLSITPPAELDPAVASDGIDFMTVFREETATGKSLKGAPIQRLANEPVKEPALIADTSTYAGSAIAHGNSVYLVAWADANGVFVKRVSNQGIVIDAQPIKIAANLYAQRPDIAWNGRSFLIAWVGTGGIVTATVSEDGAASAIQLVAADGTMEPRVAWNGKVFLLVYGVPQPCYFECIPQRAATFAVRIAADGTPIDTNPAIIDREVPSYFQAASHATIASNGSDFLVALDKPTGAVVVDVKTDGSSIAVDQRKSVFPWFTFVTNDIRWNGVQYVLASRYSSGMKQWLALTYLTPNGDPVNRRVTEVDIRATSPAAVATNSLGEDAVVIAEPAGDPAVSRTNVYFDSDFSLSPLPPNSPTKVTATGTPSHFTMTWDSGPEAEGVVIETRYGDFSLFTVVPASDHSHTFNNPAITSVTLRTLNAGGLSEAVGALLQTPPRRRATR